MSIKHTKVVALLLLVQLGHTKHCSFLNIFTSEIFRDYSCKSGAVVSGTVNRNTPHSIPVCSMFNEMAQNLNFFMFFPSITIMTLAS